MAFEWHRIHKWEDNIESQATDAVFDYVMEFYGVEEITNLTQDQIDEVTAFREDLNEYSPLQWGFTNLVNHWESETWEEVDE